MKHSKFSETQIMNILKQAQSGVPVPNICREHGIAASAFYAWRSKYGGMSASMISKFEIGAL